MSGRAGPGGDAALVAPLEETAPRGRPARHGRARRWLRRLLAALPAITREGQVLSFLLMSLCTVLVASGHRLLYFALALGLATLIIGFAYPFWNLWRVSIRRRVPPWGFAGQPLFIELAVANRRRWTPAFALLLVDDRGPLPDPRDGTVHVPVVYPRQAAVSGYHVNLPRRGRYRWRYVKIASSFPFLLFERALLIRAPSELIIYPRPGRLKGPILPRPRGSQRAQPSRVRGTQEFHKLREYQLRDDARWIHWRSTARIGKPMVREFDAEGGDSVLIVLDPGAFSGGFNPRLDRAIECLVTIARRLWRDNYRVHLALHGAAGPYETAWFGGRCDAHATLARLAEYVPAAAPPASLERLLARVQVPNRVETALVLITDQPDPGTLALAERWRSRGSVRVVDCADEAFGALFEPTTAGEVVW